MSGITILEFIGVFAFAASGAFIAIEENFDLFGIYILATVTAMGGGVFRDIVTNGGIPQFFYDYKTIPFIIIGGTLPIILRGKWIYNNLFVIIDAIGLSAFFVSSGIKAIENQYNFMLFLFCTSITGVGGGMLRDIITNRKPQVFKTDIYCVAGILGSCILWFLYPLLGLKPSEYISLFIIFVVRMFCYFKKINLPVIKNSPFNDTLHDTYK